MDAAHPSSVNTPVLVHAQLRAFNTIPVGCIFRAMDDSVAQDITPAKKPKVESLEIVMVNMATMMEQQAAQMSHMMQLSMNASVAAHQSTDNMLRSLALQMGQREAVGDPVGVFKHHHSRYQLHNLHLVCR